MKKPVRVTVWTHPSEFLQVYEWLFSRPLADRGHDDMDLERALGQMKRWAKRGEVPLAIESSLYFVDVLLLDSERLQQPPPLQLVQDEPKPATQPDNSAGLPRMELLRNPRQPGSHGEAARTAEQTRLSSKARERREPVSEVCLRLMYSMALVRFVNGLVDSQQTRLYNESMSKIAEDIGLPRMFVDLRHQATHDKLASLSGLREAAVEAIEWLRVSYWEPQAVMTQRLEADLDAFIADNYANAFTTVFSHAPSSLVEQAMLADQPNAVDRIVAEFFGSYEAAVYSAHLQRRVFRALLCRSLSLLASDLVQSRGYDSVNWVVCLWLPLLLPMLEQNLDLFMVTLIEWAESHLLQAYGLRFTFDTALSQLGSGCSAKQYLDRFEATRPIIAVLYGVIERLLQRYLSMHRPAYLPIHTAVELLCQCICDSRLGPLHPRNLRLLKVVMDASCESDAPRLLWLDEMITILSLPPTASQSDVSELALPSEPPDTLFCTADPDPKAMKHASPCLVPDWRPCALGSLPGIPSEVIYKWQLALPQILSSEKH